MNDREMFDAFYLAKRIWELQPELPAELSSQSIHILDCIHQLKKQKKLVYVSDVSTFLELPRPGITKSIRQLAQMGYVEKKADERDHRMVQVELTSLGQAVVQTYVTDYFRSIEKKLVNIPDTSIHQMAQTIEQIYQVLCKVENQDGR